MKKLGLVMIVAVVLVGASSVLAADDSQSSAALAWLRGTQGADGGFSNGFAPGSDLGTTVEVVLAAAAAGEDVSGWVSPAGNSPVDYLSAQVAAGSVSDANSLSRVIFAVVAAGQDARAFGGKDLVAALQASRDEATGQYGDSLFAHAYALLALHSAGAALPEAAVDLLASQFTADGAWALFGGSTPGTADTNTTAVAMQALVAAGRPDLAAGALPYLQRMQNDDGGFPYQKPSPWGTDTDANSTAVVLQALYALDQPLGAWAASGTDPLGTLLSLGDPETGAYYWQAAVPFANTMATAQAVQAVEGMTLVAVPRVGALRTVTVPAAPAIPLLPASGGSIMLSGLWLGAGLAAVAGGLSRRRK